MCSEVEIKESKGNDKEVTFVKSQMSKVKNHESPKMETCKTASVVPKELLLLGGEGSGKTLLSRRLNGE